MLGLEKCGQLQTRTIQSTNVTAPAFAASQESRQQRRVQAASARLGLFPNRLGSTWQSFRPPVARAEGVHCHFTKGSPLSVYGNSHNSSYMPDPQGDVGKQPNGYRHPSTRRKMLSNMTGPPQNSRGLISQIAVEPHKLIYSNFVPWVLLEALFIYRYRHLPSRRYAVTLIRVRFPSRHWLPSSSSPPALIYARGFGGSSSNRTC
ncbi:hypothetical protein J3F84DRAFT_174311 [Trichoderma pleuroticola]